MFRLVIYPHFSRRIFFGIRKSSDQGVKKLRKTSMFVKVLLFLDLGSARK